MREKRYCGKGSLRIGDSGVTGDMCEHPPMGWLSRPENQEVPQHEFLDIAELGHAVHLEP